MKKTEQKVERVAMAKPTKFFTGQLVMKTSTSQWIPNVQQWFTPTTTYRLKTYILGVHMPFLNMLRFTLDMYEIGEHTPTYEKETEKANTIGLKR